MRGRALLCRGRALPGRDGLRDATLPAAGPAWRGWRRPVSAAPCLEWRGEWGAEGREGGRGGEGRRREKAPLAAGPGKHGCAPAAAATAAAATASCRAPLKIVG